MKTGILKTLHFSLQNMCHPPKLFRQVGLRWRSAIPIASHKSSSEEAARSIACHALVKPFSRVEARFRATRIWTPFQKFPEEFGS